MKTNEEKRNYLNNYRLQLLKISRFKNMLKIAPENRKKYESEILKCQKIKEKIETDIENVDGGILSEILAEKYIFGKTLEQISIVIGYCKRQTERLHIKALENFNPVCTA